MANAWRNRCQLEVKQWRSTEGFWRAERVPIFWWLQLEKSVDFLISQFAWNFASTKKRKAHLMGERDLRLNKSVLPIGIKTVTKSTSDEWNDCHFWGALAWRIQCRYPTPIQKRKEKRFWWAGPAGHFCFLIFHTPRNFVSFWRGGVAAAHSWWLSFWRNQCCQSELKQRQSTESGSNGRSGCSFLVALAWRNMCRSIFKFHNPVYTKSIQKRKKKCETEEISVKQWHSTKRALTDGAAVRFSVALQCR